MIKVTDEMIEAGAEPLMDLAARELLTSQDLASLVLEAALSVPVPAQEAEPVAWEHTVPGVIHTAEELARYTKMYRAHSGEAEAWRYEIQYGPEGEANYAWVYRGKDMVATMKTHHAIAVVNAMNGAPAHSGEREALAIAENALEVFAEASRAIDTHDPGFPDHGAALRASFDYYTRHLGEGNSEEVTRHAVTRSDIRRAAEAYEICRAALEGKQP